MNQIPDCGACDRRECPDHGQPPNMRTVAEEECHYGPAFIVTGPPCEFYNAGADQCRVTAFINAVAGETRWPGASCLHEIVLVPTREAVCDCPLRALAQGRAFTYPAVAEVRGPWVQIMGQWPGDETDAEIEAGLAAMHGTGECPTCHGSGEVIVCVDDMCRATGHCPHRGGIEPCPDCQQDQP